MPAPKQRALLTGQAAVDEQALWASSSGAGEKTGALEPVFLTRGSRWFSSFFIFTFLYSFFFVLLFFIGCFFFPNYFFIGVKGFNFFDGQGKKGKKKEKKKNREKKYFPLIKF